MKLEDLTQWVVASPLGPLTLLATETHLVGLWFQGQKHFGAGYDLEEVPTLAGPVMLQAEAWLQAYFAGERPQADELPLSFAVTPFRQRVLAALCQIPYGQVTTYQALAEQLGSSPRAVGGAVGHNPLAIIVPCHRVVAANGQLTGFAGGMERKIQLLTHEGMTPGKDGVVALKRSQDAFR